MTNFAATDAMGNRLEETLNVDARTKLCEIVQLVKQRFAIPSDFKYKNVVVYGCDPRDYSR